MVSTRSAVHVGKATNLSLLVVLGIRRDGQKVLLSIRNMAGESEAAWRAVLDDLIAPAHAGVPDHQRRGWPRASPGGVMA